MCRDDSVEARVTKAHAAPILHADICRTDLLLEVEGVASRIDGARP